MSHILNFSSESVIKKAFRHRDQKKVILPPKISFPFSSEYYFTWSEPSGVYRYLVIQKPTGEYVGMIFETCGPGDSTASRLCDWCHSYGPADQIDLLTVSPSSRRTVGVFLCCDLSCIEKLEVTRRSFEQHARELCDKILRFYAVTFENVFYN
jgi:hypothetical protein